MLRPMGRYFFQRDFFVRKRKLSVILIIVKRLNGFQLNLVQSDIANKSYFVISLFLNWLLQPNIAG